MRAHQRDDHYPLYSKLMLDSVVASGQFFFCLVRVYIQRKIFFRRSIFLYSPCPNLEGIKDALAYKFRRLTIGQNCCAVWTNKVARAQGPQRCIILARARASGTSAVRFDRPARQANEPRAKREVMSALCHGLVVDSTFEHLIHGEFAQLLLASSEGYGLRLAP